MSYALSGFATPGPSKDAYIMVYASTDNTATVEGAGYFNSATQILGAQGVIIHIDEGTSTVIYGYQNDGTTVTLDTSKEATID